MPGGGQESATNLSAYRYLQNTVDDMSGWGWFSLCGVGDFVKNWWTQKYCQIPSLKCLITNVTMMIPNIMPIYSKYLDREKTNINCHANWPCNLTMTPRTWTNLQLVGWKKEEESGSSNGPAKARPNWNVSYKQMPTNLDEQHHKEGTNICTQQWPRLIKLSIKCFSFANYCIIGHT